MGLEEAKSEIEAVDLSKVAASLLLEKHLEFLDEVLTAGCEIKKTFSNEAKEILDSEENQKFEKFNLQMAVAKMSEESVARMKSNISIIRDFLREDSDSLMEHQEVLITELFLVLLKTLKPKSKRHLQTFLQAMLDDEWVDAMIVGKGKDTEFRTIDRCSESARTEFGLAASKSA